MIRATNGISPVCGRADNPGTLCGMPLPRTDPAAIPTTQNHARPGPLGSGRFACRTARPRIREDENHHKLERAISEFLDSWAVRSPSHGHYARESFWWNEEAQRIFPLCQRS